MNPFIKKKRKPGKEKKRRAYLLNDFTLYEVSMFREINIEYRNESKLTVFLSEKKYLDCI